MEQEKYLDRELYRKIKSMKRDELERTLKNMYQLGYDAALKEATVDLDTEKLRAEIGKIKGIGENRLNEIMAAIEKVLSEKESSPAE